MYLVSGRDLNNFFLQHNLLSTKSRRVRVMKVVGVLLAIAVIAIVGCGVAGLLAFSAASNELHDDLTDSEKDDR